MHQKVRNIRWEGFWVLLEAQNKAIPRLPPKGQTEEWKALKLSAKAANVPEWAQHSQETILELGGTMGDGNG
jgi:hypothetical protein